MLQFAPQGTSVAFEEAVVFLAAIPHTAFFVNHLGDKGNKYDMILSYLEMKFKSHIPPLIL